MYITLIIALLLLAILFHELGHALAMKRYKVEVAELGIGLPFAPQVSIESPWIEKLLNPCASFTVSPWLIGAYVKPAKCNYEKALSYSEKAHINGAGIIANIAFGLFLLAGLTAVSLFSSGWRWSVASYTVAAIAGGFLVLRYARFISAYIFPPLAIVALAAFVHMFWGVSPKEAMDSMGGPVSIVKVGQKHIQSLWDVVYFGALVSFAIAFVNLLPIFPLDGGQTWKLILERISPVLSQRAEKVGMIIFFLLILTAVIGDIRVIFS